MIGVSSVAKSSTLVKWINRHIIHLCASFLALADLSASVGNTPYSSSEVGYLQW